MARRMRGGGHDNGGHMGMMGGDNSGETNMAKPCLTTEQAQAAISDLQRVRDSLAKIQGLDANADSVPDLCVK